MTPSTDAASSRATEPAALARLLKGDLDWITTRALAKDRTRRYQTANALALDIERYLNDEPVLAGPPTGGYRLSKLIKRHRLAALAAAVVTAAVLLGLAVASFGLLEARRERDTAERARRESEAVTDFLAGMMAAADPGIDGKDVTVREVLDRAAATIEEELADQPLLEARLRRTIGDTYEALGLYEQAQLHHQRRLEIHDRLQPPDAPDRLDALSALGSLKQEQGLEDEALAIAEEVYERRRRTLGERHPDTIAAMSQLGNRREDRGDYEEAEALLSRAVELRRAILGEDHLDTALSLANLGRMLWMAGRPEEGLPLLERALEIETGELGEEHPTTLVTMGNHAAVLHETGHGDEAITVRRKMLEIQRRTLGEEHPHTLITMTNLAVVLSDDPRSMEEATELLQETVDIHVRRDGADHPRTLYASHNLATIYSDQNRLEDAERVHRQNLPRMRTVLGNDDMWTVNSVGSLATVLCRQHEYREAEELFREFERNAPRALPAEHPQLFIYARRHGECLVRQSAWDTAESLLLQAHAGLTRTLGDSHGQTRRAAESLAELYEASGRPAEAARYRDDPPE